MMSIAHSQRRARGLLERGFSLLLAVLFLMTSTAHAQSAVFKDEELDQMLAPIALYPDALLSQILMASTYPLDVKDAAAWSKARPDLKGDAAVKQVQGQPWEPSVQSLVAFPQVLSMMGDHPADVQRLGDAFLADPGRVMDRVQYLRRKAQEAGSLKSTEQQTVTVKTEASKQVIVVEPAKPDVIYVPVYQPTVVYGTWAYPSYPPVYWPPPPYYYPPTGGAFVAGMIWGAAIVGISNSCWGGFNWGYGNVNINVNRYNNVNINRQISNTNNTFVHNPERRGNVPYADNRSREQFGARGSDGVADRQAYRGRDAGDGRDADRARANDVMQSRGVDTGRAAGGAAGANRAGGAVADRAGGVADRAPVADRAGGASDRAAAAGGRGDFPGSVGDRSAGGNAMSGIRNPDAARADAARGQASRASMGQASAAPAARPQAAPAGGRGGMGGGGMGGGHGGGGMGGGHGGRGR